MSAGRLRDPALDWVFDLDNTLYPAESTLYDAIGDRMTAYIARVARVDAAAALALREHYFLEYGATVVGLVRHHGVDARDFMHDVHQVDFSVVHPDPALRGLIDRLPGRKFVFTNGAAAYAQEILAHLALDDLFDAICDLESNGLAPKPQIEAYHGLVAQCGIAPDKSVLVEDTLRNLIPAHAMGFVTALVGPVRPEPLPDYVDAHAHDLHALLRTVVA